MTATLDPATAECPVPLAPPAAFSPFTDGLARWWPRAYAWSGEALVAMASPQGWRYILAQFAAAAR